MMLLRLSEKYADNDLLKSAQSLLDDVEKDFNECSGISVNGCELLSEDEFTLGDLRQWKRWDFDELSFRDGNFEDVPTLTT